MIPMFDKMGLTLLETEDSKAIQTQLDKLLLSDLHENTFPTTVYLDEEHTGTGTRTHNPLIPLQNPFPKHTESLVHFSIHSHDETILHNHILLPQTLMPVLDRAFIPSKIWHLENVYSTSEEQTVTWVAVPMTFYHRCRIPEDFLIEVESALQGQWSDRRCVIVDKPGVVSKHAFWLQVRGFFRGPDDVFAAARRQASLLRQLIIGGYIVLGQEVLGADRRLGTMYVPPSKHVHSKFLLGSIRGCLGDRSLR